MIVAKRECLFNPNSAEDVDHRASVEWDESEDVDDGRPDYSERKICNFKTSWLADCPSKLLDVCKTKEEIERMQFWELFSEDVYQDGNWDMDKCPAVKYKP